MVLHEKFTKKARVWGLAIGLSFAAFSTSKAASAQEFIQEIIPDVNSHHKHFAEKLAIDGDTAVMGDYNYMMEGNCGYQEHGAVQVLKKVNGIWEKAEFFRYPDNVNDIQRHGWSVAIKGNVIVAATGGKHWVHGSTVRKHAGALSVYKRANASAPFAFVGQLFMPVPEENDFLGFPVDIASNGVFVAVVSEKHRGDIRIFRVEPTLEYVTSIPYPNPPAGAWKMFITNQNILVSDSGYFPAPFAWKLEDTGATPIDTSSLAGHPMDSTRGVLTGDGDTVAWFVRDGTWPQELVRFAKFGSNSVLSVTTEYLPQGQVMPQGQTALPVSLEEDQGLFYGVGEWLASYKYVDGRYRYQGKFYHGGLQLRALAFNGTDLLVGDRTPQHPTNVPCGGNTGSIWVYRPLATTAAGPGVSTKLQPSLHTPVYNNGTSVALSGSFAVSASPDTWHGDDVPYGTVFLHQNVNGTWRQVEAYVDTWSGIHGSGSLSGFGTAVDVNSQFLAIGAPWATTLYGGVTGTVQFVGKWGGTFLNGAFLSEIHSPSYDEWGENFGASVALSGNTLFVGAPAWGSGPGSPYSGGSVYVYTLDWSGFWYFVQQIKNPNVQPYEGFGYRVSAYGDNLIVGIPYRSTNGFYNNGAVEIFQKDAGTGTYVSAGEFFAPSNLGHYTNFGLSVSMSGDFAAAGSPAGTVVVYQRSGTTWAEHQYMPITSTDWGFGTSVAIDGSNLVVGSPWQSRVHRLTRSTWWGLAWWTLDGTLVGPTSSFATSADIEGNAVTLGESYGWVGNNTVGASYALDLSAIQ